MPLDPRAQRFLDMAAIAPGAAAGRPPLAERRKALEKLMQFARADHLSAGGVDGTLASPPAIIRYRLYTPGPAAASGPVLLFFHGGGMVAGSIETHDLICRALAAESGLRTISVDYRLAPEHPFPAAIEDALAAISFLHEHGGTLEIDCSRVIVCGDSAGATLAARACQELRGTPLAPFLQCLICPVLDSGAVSASRAEFANGFLIDRTTLEADLADYLPQGLSATDPRISPLRAPDLQGLPPAIIHTAEFDPLRDEGDAYATRLREAGVKVMHTCHRGMLHNFHALGAVLPQGRAVLAAIGAEIREMLAQGT